MTWGTGTIRLEAARNIFSGVEFEEIRINDKTAGYKATIDGKTIEDQSLTQLCKRLWGDRLLEASTQNSQ